MVDDNRTEALNNLMVAEILHGLHGILSMSMAERKNKAVLVQCVLDHAPGEKVEELTLAGWRKREENANKRKCKWEATSHRYWVKRRRKETECVGDQHLHGTPGEEVDFMQLPSEKELKECYKRFYAATLNDALVAGICGVCAHECGPMDEKLTWWKVAEIPHGERLIVDEGSDHGACDRFKGMLLEPKAVMKREGEMMVSICSLCLGHLRDAKKTTPPRLSLANGLWIGRVPWQLAVLTFAEQLLVALLYPRVFVFKLFLKKMGGTRSTANL
ncbi:hypothetical protein BU15DRAFT_79235 [Melanogaster broomeanus]|nr:hypothetical protein BU15DRAFT_79235 [Melanogaster broomeanus]